MTGQHLQDLRNALIAHGINPSARRSEEDLIVRAWLCDDLQGPAPARWRELLPQAVELGRDLYRSFTAAYAAAFLQTDGPGERQVGVHLRRRFGFVSPPTVEVILERIRERRLLLLGHFRRKYQPSLFAAQTFAPNLIPGYLRRVAKLESLKVPDAELPWCRGRFGPAAAGEEGPGVDYRELGERLSAFWSAANGFKPEHRLEGLVSLGLGEITRVPELQDRCRRLLAEKLPHWEARRDRLRRRCSRALNRREELGEQLAGLPSGQRTAFQPNVAAAEARLDRCHKSLDLHPLRLRPRPREVLQILEGCVRRASGGLRHERVGREVALFGRRVREGWVALGGAGTVPPEVQALGRAVAAHLEATPPSPRQHGLAEGERRRRLDLRRAWLAEGADLLGASRGCLGRLRAAPGRGGPCRDVVEAWLIDVEDLYELGVLVRKGVLRALGRRHGWRLLHTLRVTGSVTECVTGHSTRGRLTG